MNKPLTLSIIIPVYNEEHRIRACLDAIAEQELKPKEVIVVDNNCSDRSAKIAASYSFVKVVTEKEQGLIFSRNRGFNIATGDILARIDADSILSANWSKVLLNTFENNEIVGVTGPGYSLLLPRIRKPMTLMWSRMYFLWTHMFYRAPVLWGANMAIRRDAWQGIKTKVCLNDQTVHEDQDISLLLQANGGKLRYNNQLRFTSYSQAYHYFPKLVQYTVMRHTTRNHHREIGSLDRMVKDIPLPVSFLFYSIAWIVLFIFFFASFLAWPIDAIMKARGKQEEWLS
ncbi:MAG: hypothetical protein QG628_229 [Patescibacteria group bacterium]|jgi:cellulose synthase/poly-beta-1,6-N-acetylglucosamine synthase-like glycosyltransferase|nr:hypothetical protein [Patescibacteria group bacterium]